jgi:hypothetical protein
VAGHLPRPAIVRLHGRNRATWAKKGISATERCNYLYADEELCELADRKGVRIPDPQRRFVETWALRTTEIGPNAVSASC